MADTFSSPPPAESAAQLMVLPPASAEAGPAPSGTLPPQLQGLLRHPLVLAGGAVLAGVVFSRVLATPAARKIARDLAVEAFKHLKPVATMAGTAAAGSLIEMGVERYRGQITDFGKKMLADLLLNKE